ncbi:hypothetical protein P4129_09865 [Pseudomonas aeruginosa]|nr:hypothetical protein [Pseudomonas aeruginosa]
MDLAADFFGLVARHVGGALQEFLGIGDQCLEFSQQFILCSVCSGLAGMTSSSGHGVCFFEPSAGRKVQPVGTSRVAGRSRRSFH